MFRCSDTTFVTFENRKFCFLDWLYFCFTCIQFSRCKLFWRFDPSKPNNEYLSQPCVEKCLRKTIRNASHYSCICSANLPKTSLSACLASNPFWQKLLCSFFSAFLHRKEVIQPHLPIRLPCYDFTPVTGFTFGGSFLTVRSPTSGASNSHGVTGGVYKARERIHRDILIRDY